MVTTDPLGIWITGLSQRSGVAGQNHYRLSEHRCVLMIGAVLVRLADDALGGCRHAARQKRRDIEFLPVRQVPRTAIAIFVSNRIPARLLAASFTGLEAIRAGQV
jgi:hypothetical protein